MRGIANPRQRPVTGKVQVMLVTELENNGQKYLDAVEFKAKKVQASVPKKLEKKEKTKN